MNMQYNVYAKCNGCGGGNGSGIGFGYAPGNDSIYGVGGTVMAHYRYKYDNLINASGGGAINMATTGAMRAGVGMGSGVWSPYFINEPGIIQLGCTVQAIIPVEVAILDVHA